jgi:hypothetical protein
MGEDVEMLEAQVRSLEATVRQLKAARRDEFAQAAMSGLLARHGTTYEPKSVAKLAYGVADAMMEARES